MIKTQYRLQLAPGKKGGFFHFEFGKGADTMVVTENPKRLIKKSEMLPSDKVWTVNLREDSNPFITFFYDPNNASTEEWKKIAEQIKTNHDKTNYVIKRKPDGTYLYGEKPVRVNPHIFDFVDETQLAMENYVVLKNMIRAMNAVARMNVRDRAKVLFYYGINPNTMTSSEMFMRLADPNGGMAVRRDIYDYIEVNGRKKSRTYLEHFIDTFLLKEDITTVVTSTVRKAMMVTMPDIGKPLIERRPDSGYYINDRLIAPTFEEMIVVVASDKKLYELIKTRVEQFDVVNENDEERILRQFGLTLDEAGRVKETGGIEARRPEIQELINYCVSLLNIEQDYMDTLTDKDVIKVYEEGRMLEKRAKAVKLGKLFSEGTLYDVIKHKVEEAEAILEKRRVKKADVVE